VRVLIAEDEPLARHLLRRTLEGWGYEVVAASDGDQAWAALDTDDRPTIAILDWMMPGLDGVEVCRRLRQSTGRPYVYVVMLTARGRREDVVAALNAGADDIVAKPFDHLELQARLRTAVRIVDLESRLHFQAAHDPLTSVLNRKATQDRLLREIARAVRTAKPLAVLLLDLDRFKLVNDTYGHAAGDQVLIEATRRVQDVLRPYDTLGRWGGEEFVVALPECEEHVAREVAERIRASIADRPFEHGLRVTVSIGVAWGLEPSLGGYLKSADLALYRAKNAGRDRVEMGAPVRGEELLAVG
jgi:two-component system cell cycle response regulator